MNTNTRQFDVSMHAETSGIYTKQQYVYVNDRQRYATINHIHKNIQSPLVLIRSEREKREREKKREKKKEGKRTNKANTQTKQPWRNIPNNNIQSFLISIYELAKRNNV